MKLRKIVVFLLALSMLIFISAEAKAEEQKPEQKINYLVLVNGENKIPDDWKEKVTLFPTVSAYGIFVNVEHATLTNFCALQSALLKEGIGIEIGSAYRSMEYQEELMKRVTAEYGEDYALTHVEAPGFSEQQTGLAIDICIISRGAIVDSNDQMLKEKDIFSKIHQKLADYGFILRYPKGKANITGHLYEPWHIRFINDVDVAKEIQSNDITLEEFLINK